MSSALARIGHRTRQSERRGSRLAQLEFFDTQRNSGARADD
jgi:hypothetical protein